ncbi:unnamed protein product [Danaus chrysippus]|uniref:(African queen) hypothetical protein n=1 Tax=Danaus chrysippus TaxID=151541 RepID=A0A8J2QIT0_9NEOP|nr:unnamed protein product [Danaus chrysippus]
MLRSVRKCVLQRCYVGLFTPKQTFLTDEYKCNEAWKAHLYSPILTKVNLNDFYSILDQNFNSKGVISAIDVDIFANALKDSNYLEELKDLLHKLRLSAETGNTLESTHHATVRNFIEFGNVQDIVSILKEPLKFGIFLDFYTANILLDKLVTSKNYELAANVASLVMLQEDFSNSITSSLCQYACYKYVSECEETKPTSVEQEDDSKKKKEEIKIRIKFLRNPYFDDHFDLTNLHLLSGKTLAWISKVSTDNLSNNLQVIGWLFYKKYNRLLELCKEIVKMESTKVYKDVIELLKKELEKAEEDNKVILQNCVELLSNAPPSDVGLEDSMKIAIENCINKTQNKDVSAQKELFKNWERMREEKLEEQTKRLDRTRHIKMFEEKQKQLASEEQRLWFFDNEEQIDLQIEEKEKLQDPWSSKKGTKHKGDEDYVPPEILPKRK